MDQQLTLQNLEAYPLQQEPQEVGRGIRAFVYRISENHVAKIPHDKYDFLENNDVWLRNDESAIEEIVHEYEIARELFDGGVCVPRPEGIFSIHMGREPYVLAERGTNYPGFVMEYVPGEIIVNIEEDYELRIKIYDEEVKKAQELGFLTEDADGINGIWSPTREKVYIFDFGEWAKVEDVD